MARRWRRVMVSALVAMAIAPGAACALPVGTIDLDLQQNLRVDSELPAGISDPPMRLVPLGDMNGDGRDDLAVGIPGVSSGRGAVWVLFGPDPAALEGDPIREVATTLDQMTAPGSGRGFRVTTTTPSQQLGIALAGGRDVNGDGRPELVVGSRQNAYVVHGKAGDGEVSVDALGTGGFAITGPDAQSLDLAPDMTGDGRAEVVVGELTADNLPGGTTSENSGSVWVVFGRAETTPVTLATLGAAGYEIRGQAAGHNAGWGVAATPDMNGDGRPEIIVGVPGMDDDPGFAGIEGAAYVVHGRAAGSAVVELGQINGNAADPGFRIGGPRRLTAFSANLGREVAGGDFNGDGRGDAAAGAATWNHEPDVTGGNKGGVWVVFGRQGTAAVSLNQNATAGDPGSDGYRIDGIRPSSFTGRPTRRMPDVNGDGRDELLLGVTASNDNSGAHVVLGRATTGRVDLSVPGAVAFEFRGRQNADDLDERAGNGDAAALDLNGDGLMDYALGADRSGRVAPGTGSVYVHYGREEGPSVDLAAAPAGTIVGRIDAGTCPAGPSVDRVRPAGDVNGDGRQDVVVSSDGDDSVYVVFGVDGAPTTTLCALGTGGFRISNVLSGSLEPDAAGGGDVNNDGRDDIVIGANDAQGGNGVGWVVFGKTDGSTVNLATFPQASNPQGFRIQPDFPISGVAELGIDVAIQQDLNADGRDEVVISQSNPAGVYVIRGRTSGATVDLETDTASVRHTAPVSRGIRPIADLNGDGLAELVVGNPDPTSAFVDNGPFVIMGRSDLTAVNVASFPSAAGYELAGDLRQFARMTAAPAVTADMVGDGRQDIISIGETGSPATGVAVLVPGSPTPPVFDSHTTPGQRVDAPAGLVIESATGIGDVNGDGRGDLLVGTFLADNRGRTDSGSAHIVFGKAGSRPIDLANAGREAVRLDGAGAGDGLGREVLPVGDRTGDGIPEFALMAPGTTQGGSVLFVNGVIADQFAPQTTITDGPSGNVAGGTATFSFTASEPGVVFTCSLDGAPFAPCTSPVTLTGLAIGQHTFRVRAADIRGNVDATPAERTFTVLSTTVVVPPDTTPPVQSLVSLTRTRFAVVGVRSARRPAPPRGTVVRWRLNEAGRTTLRFERVQPGRRAGARCVVGRAVGRRCTVFRHVGSVVRIARVGANRFAFTGRIAGRALAPGNYRAVLTTRDAAGNVSRKAIRTFTVIR